jgi:ribokinase
MAHLLIVGSYNAAFTVYGDELPSRGQTVLGNRIDVGPGGKGNNQAIAARRLGAEVTFVVKVGADTLGAEARELIAREGLPTGAVLNGRERTGIALIMVDRDGSNLISVAPGANSELEFGEVVGLSGLFEDATYLLCQLECRSELFVEVAQWARNRGITTVLNPAPAMPLGPEACRLVDLLTPNETELSALTGLQLATESDVISAARQLIAAGTGEVVVTLGERGTMHVTATDAQAFAAYPVTAVDTTGAGDAFNGALVVGLAEGLEMASAIDLAMRAGAYCTTKVGVIDGLATQQELDLQIPSRRKAPVYP